jgi:hypothetical protein
MTSSDTSPAIEMTRAMTIANRGRSTKIAESVARQSFGDDYVFAAGSAGFDMPDRHLPVFDDKHVHALLIGE